MNKQEEKLLKRIQEVHGNPDWTFDPNSWIADIEDVKAKAIAEILENTSKTTHDFLERHGELRDIRFIADLYTVIRQAIAEHEASQWKKYPENLPPRNNKSEYHVTVINRFSGKPEIKRDYWIGEMWQLYGERVIAFRELPALYQEGGEE